MKWERPKRVWKMCGSRTRRISSARSWGGVRKIRFCLLCFLFAGRKIANVGRKLRVLTAQQGGQRRAEVRTVAPFAHVVFPRAPAAQLLFCHVIFVKQQVGAFE